MFFGVGGDTIQKAFPENVGKGAFLRGSPLRGVEGGNGPSPL